MSRLRLSLAVSVALLAAAFLCAAPAGAAVPAGPRMVFLEAEFVLGKSVAKSEATARERYVSSDPRGHDRRPLPVPSSLAYGGLKLSWTADGSQSAFVGKPPKEAQKGAAPEERGSPFLAYVVNADGTGAHAIAGTDGTSDAVISPDGRWIAFSQLHEHHPKIDPKHPNTIIESLTHGYESKSTWIVPTTGGKPRRLTRWSNYLFSEPDSFSPDDSTLLVSVYKPGSKNEVDAIDLATGKQRTIEVSASEAAYSPDGSRIAFISYRDHEAVSGFDGLEGTSEVYVAGADGSGAHRVTRTPKLDESAPNWDPSGERLAFLSSPGGMLGILKGGVAEANPDGTCRTVIPRPEPRRKHAEMVIGEPSWMPGPERGAGPISC